MQDRPDFPPSRPETRLIYPIPPAEPAEDIQGYMGSLVLRELLALPPAVLNPPVFTKVRNYLKHYRETL
jgi:hypothetical protein